MTRNFIRAAVCAIGAAASLAIPLAVQAQMEPIRIGFLTVRSGALAAGGRQMEEGIQLFLKERNHTIAGRKVELIIADTGGNPAGAKTKTQELVERNRVHVIIGPLAADGIHCLGNGTLDHVWWQDIGEDAATALGPAGTVMNITCGAAYQGSDKTFQFNGRGEMRISNFYVSNEGW